jgi:glycosyltransferase involved in cell wall biosynthesis
MKLVSIILSAYNEPLEMISKSVNSLIDQTYKNLEIILINDNPSRKDLDDLLNGYKKKDNRIRYIKHTKNRGLVYSLNEGIKNAKGDIIARMDADDISEKDRIEKQIAFLKKHSCDIVGSCIVKIDENDNKIGELTLPTLHNDIVRFMQYGSYVLHPTWLVKKQVYIDLEGYRNIAACEDYDFLLRAIINGYKLGNTPNIGLKYRIRSDGISQSSDTKQKLTMYYLAKKFKNKTSTQMSDLNKYLNSPKYQKEYKRLEKYRKYKNDLNNGNYFKILPIILNKYFYINLIAHYKRKEGEKYRAKF